MILASLVFQTQLNSDRRAVPISLLGFPKPGN